MTKALATTANTARPLAQGYVAQLNDLYLRAVLGARQQFIVETAPIQAQRVQTSESPEEFSSEFGEVFARSDFTFGDGLDFAHERNAPVNAAARFYDSYGLDISRPGPGEQRSVTLALKVAQNRADVSLTGPSTFLSGILYAADGNNVLRYVPSTGAVTTEDPHAGDPATAVLDLTTGPTEIYAALGTNGVHRRSGAGTWAAFSAATISKVWFLKRRLVGANGVEFSEFSSAGVATLRGTLPTGATWTSATDAGAAILVGATDGYVYAFTLNASDVLALAGQTQFEGETVQGVLATRGIVLVSTLSNDSDVARLWSATYDAGTLTDLQVLREWDTANPITALVTDGEIVRFVVNDSDVEVWQLDLVTMGLSRKQPLPAAVTGTVSDVHLDAGEPILVVAADGIYQTGTALYAEGWLISPLADFFTADDKAWARAEVDCDVDAGTVTLLYTTDPDALNDQAGAGWSTAVTVTSSTSAAEANLIDVSSRYIAGQVRLTPTGSAGPVLRSFAFRGLPTTDEVIVQIPVVVSDRIERPHRRPYRVAGRGHAIWAELRTMEGQAATLRLLRPPLLVRGVVERVGAVIEEQTRRGSLTAYAVVQVRGRKGTDAESVDAGLVGGEEFIGGEISLGAVA